MATPPRPTNPHEGEGTPKPPEPPRPVPPRPINPHMPRDKDRD